MIKQVTYFQKKPGLKSEDFLDYWYNKHPAVVCKLNGITRYVQNHILSYENKDPKYDGVAEVWFEDIASMRTNIDSYELSAIQNDEENFIHTQTMGTVITNECDIKKPLSNDGPKLLGLINRHRDLSVDSFRGEWFSNLGPKVSKLVDVVGYTQAPTRSGIYKTGRIPDFDGVACLWFKSETSRSTTLSSEFMRQIQQIEVDLIDFSRSELFWVRPVTII